jgi:hypothetical protein
MVKVAGNNTPWGGIAFIGVIRGSDREGAVTDALEDLHPAVGAVNRCHVQFAVTVEVGDRNIQHAAVAVALRAIAHPMLQTTVSAGEEDGDAGRTGTAVADSEILETVAVEVTRGNRYRLGPAPSLIRL